VSDAAQRGYCPGCKVKVNKPESDDYILLSDSGKEDPCEPENLIILTHSFLSPLNCNYPRRTSLTKPRCLQMFYANDEQHLSSVNIIVLLYGG
jgi:hypothetical protein